MTSSIPGGSAQIYEFPARGRYALNRRDQRQAPGETESAPAAKVTAGSGWYHEAAIEEAARQS